MKFTIATMMKKKIEFFKCRFAFVRIFLCTFTRRRLFFIVKISPFVFVSYHIGDSCY